MDLLTPQEQEETSSREEREKSGQLTLLEHAISGANKTLNELHDQERSERERITRDHEDLLARHARERRGAESDTNKNMAIKAKALEPLDKKER